MFAITVTDKGGGARRLDFDKTEVTIGRVKGNDIVLPKGNVSKRHARVVLKDGKFIVVDLKSTNGTYVNGRKITSPLVVKQTDKVYIGDFILNVDDAERGAQVEEHAAAGATESPIPEAIPKPKTIPPMAPPPASRGRAPSAAPPRSRPASAAPPALDRARAPSVPPPSVRPPRPAPRVSEAPPAPTPEPLAPPIIERASSIPPSPMEQAANVSQNYQSPPVAAPKPKPSTNQLNLQLPPSMIKQLGLQRDVLEQLDGRMGINALSVERLGEEAIWQQAESGILDIVKTLERDGQIPSDVDSDTLIKETLNEALGLGPLEDLLADDSVDQILVDKRDQIVVSRDGNQTSTGVAFSSDECFQRVIQRLVAPSGQSIHSNSPVVSARMGDGTAVIAAFPPVALRGACLTLIKPKASRQNLSALVAQGSMSPAMSDFLSTCVTARKNILVTGSPSSGKGNVLSALASATGDSERLISVDGSGQLNLHREAWVALESGPGREVKELIHTALAMQPDRLVVSDLRGSETMSLVQCMGSTHDGILASVGARDALSSLAQLCSLCRLDGIGASTRGLSELVASAVHVVVQVTRYGDNISRISSIHEMVGVKDEVFSTREIFSYDGSQAFVATGVVPRFYAELDAVGILADASIFST